MPNGDDRPVTPAVGDQLDAPNPPGGVTPVLEHAVLDVLPGQEAEFEQAFAEARAHIASAAGFATLGLSRCVERPNRYLLLVGWDSLEDHTEGFRGSPAYESWRRLLHHFYDPFPTVEHYVETEGP